MEQERKFARIEREGKVAKVILNDPDRRNSLSRELVVDLMGCYEELRDDESVKVVITTGAGDVAWCAGRSGQERLQNYDERKKYGKLKLPQIPTDDVLRHYPKVTIAAVNGYCLGGAITFLIAHDLAIASEERARFGLPEVMHGFPPKSILATLFRAVPMKWAFDMVLTGDNWDARTAQRAGLVTRVVPHAELEARAMEWAQEIARWDPLTLEYCKKAAHAAMDEPVYEKAKEIASCICELHGFVNKRAYAGMQDFLNKTGRKAIQMIKWVERPGGGC